MAQEEPKLEELESIKKELEEAKAKCDEYLNGWKRERADFLNYKKNEVDKMAELLKYSNEEMILKIIPVLDNIYLAEAHIPEELKDHQWIKGFKHIKTQLEKFLKEEGIEHVKALGETFDPATMDAVEEVESKDEAPGVVIEESQRGYAMHGKIIRAAKVKISK